MCLAEFEENPYYHSEMDLPNLLDPTLVRDSTRLDLATVMELAGYLGERVVPSPPWEPISGEPYVYPNPLKLYTGSSSFHFVNLKNGAQIAVYDLHGSKVLDVTATTDQFVWDPQAASGIYFYSIDNTDKQYKGKLAIIK